jgi:hypothetical protein
MKTEIINNLLGTMSISFLISFYIFALFGVIFSMLVHFKKKAKSTPPSFSFKYWIQDNLARLFTSIMTIFLVARFAPELSIPFEVNMFLAVLVGVGLDRIIIAIRNRTAINLFQKK